MKKDVFIQDFGANYNVSLIDNQSQRAINWLKINTKQIFTNYGVNWQEFVLKQTTDISLQAIQEYATQELSKNGMNFEVVNLDLTDPSAPVFNIKELQNDLE